jgi:putative pyruvate formate lyase activating enzyme
MKSRRAREAAKLLTSALKKCSICPRRCGVDRTKGKRGYCRAGLKAAAYSYSPHHGEEPPLSGTRGSGTIFFAHCNMRCVYCQNYYFSQLDNGKEVSTERLSAMMLELEGLGCHNINLVSPTHFVPQIVAALAMAFEKGLAIQILYNTGGYDLPETVKMLEGIIDIYMPDMRYADNKMAARYSDAADYVERNRACVKEMHRQVGALSLDKYGVAERGLIIRLLALPEDISGTRRSLAFIADEISKATYLSIMSQYYPTYRAYEFRELSRRVTAGEYANIVDEAKKLGLNNGWVQGMPKELDARFLGTNLEPKEDIGDGR